MRRPSRPKKMQLEICQQSQRGWWWIMIFFGIQLPGFVSKWGYPNAGIFFGARLVSQIWSFGIANSEIFPWKWLWFDHVWSLRKGLIAGVNKDCQLWYSLVISGTGTDVTLLSSLKNMEARIPQRCKDWMRGNLANGLVLLAVVDRLGSI